MVNVCLSLPRAFVRLVTFGRVDLALTECIVALKKEAVARGAPDDRASDAPHRRAALYPLGMTPADERLSASQ